MLLFVKCQMKGSSESLSKRILVVLELKFLSPIPSGSLDTWWYCMLNAFFHPPLPAVSSIKRHHLVEIRTMANPPHAVKLALESISLLLGEEETSDWKKIRTVILRDNFISSIVNFNSEDMRYLGFLSFYLPW